MEVALLRIGGSTPWGARWETRAKKKEEEWWDGRLCWIGEAFFFLIFLECQNVKLCYFQEF